MIEARGQRSASQIVNWSNSQMVMNGFNAALPNSLIDSRDDFYGFYGFYDLNGLNDFKGFNELPNSLIN
jgi:hypothetical protein